MCETIYLSIYLSESVKHTHVTGLLAVLKQTHGSRYVATTLYVTKRADQRYTERECAQKEKVRNCLSRGSNR